MTHLSSKSRSAIAASLPQLEPKRDEFAIAMLRHLSVCGPKTASDEARSAAIAALLDMLFDQAHAVGGTSEVADLGQHSERHRDLKIDSGIYSCFGDGLSPILKDVLGSDATLPIVAAWLDLYWASKRAMRSTVTRLAA